METGTNTTNENYGHCQMTMAVRNSSNFCSFKDPVQPENEVSQSLSSSASQKLYCTREIWQGKPDNLKLKHIYIFEGSVVPFLF